MISVLKKYVYSVTNAYDSYIFILLVFVFVGFHFCACYTPQFISGLVTESSSTHQCYMGICLPRELALLYPREEPATKSAEQKDRGRQSGDSDRQRSTSLGEMEDLQEAG
jgi:hypothetical protein